MKTSENVRSLINNYFRYLSSSTESEKDSTSALESITVVRRIDDKKYKMIGITTDTQSGERIFMFKSHSPLMKEHEGIGGCSLEYDYCEINEYEFDEKFLTYDAWQHGLLTLTIAEMNAEIFKFLHPYFITANQDWTFELSCRGAIMSLKFYGYGAYKYDKLVIRVDKINRASITLYGDGHNESITIFDYDDTAVTMDPVPSYGVFTEEDMVKLCDKVEEVMRRNLK